MFIVFWFPFVVAEIAPGESRLINIYHRFLRLVRSNIFSTNNQNKMDDIDDRENDFAEEEEEEIEAEQPPLTSNEIAAEASTIDETLFVLEGKRWTEGGFMYGYDSATKPIKARLKRSNTTKTTSQQSTAGSCKNQSISIMN